MRFHLDYFLDFQNTINSAEYRRKNGPINFYKILHNSNMGKGIEELISCIVSSEFFFAFKV